MPVYGNITAAYQGTVDVVLETLPYTVPGSGTISDGPGLIGVADIPVVSTGLFTTTGAGGSDTRVGGLQIWFLDRTGFTTLSVGTVVTASNQISPWKFGNGNWSQWGNVNGVTTLSTTNWVFLGNFPAGTLAATNFTNTNLSTAAWGGTRLNNFSPITWLGNTYLMVASDSTSGEVMLGHSNGTATLATVWPGKDTAKSLRMPHSFPDTGNGFNYFLQDGQPTGSGGPSLIQVSSSNALTATYTTVILSDSTHNSLFVTAMRSNMVYVWPSGWGIVVVGGVILLSSDGSKYWFYQFSGADSSATTIIGDPSTFSAAVTIGVHIQTDNTIWFNRIDTGSPTQLLVSVLPTAAAARGYTLIV